MQLGRKAAAWRCWTIGHIGPGRAVVREIQAAGGEARAVAGRRG
ncbi:MAG: hypothetical protein WKG07_11325 [Hymenobacter sp.]